MATNPIIRKIRKIGARRHEPASHIKAALETGRVETNFTNPSGGDADSENWRQERKSGYEAAWNKTGGPLNLDGSINRFYDEADNLDHGQKSYDLAADVQRPAAQYRGRYKGASKEAQALLAGGGSAGRSPEGGTTLAAMAGVGSQDPSAARRAALQNYLETENTDSSALLNLKSNLNAAAGAQTTATASAMPDVKTALTARRASSASAQNALTWAQSKVGQPGSAETGGANHGKLADYANSRFGMSGQPWCAMFTSLAVTKGGAPASARTASVAAIRQKAQSGEGYEKGFVTNAKPGDLVLFGNKHVGMVKRVDGGTIHYIGGNQSDNVTEASTSASAVDIVRPQYGAGR